MSNQCEKLMLTHFFLCILRIRYYASQKTVNVIYKNISRNCLV